MSDALTELMVLFLDKQETQTTFDVKYINLMSFYYLNLRLNKYLGYHFSYMDLLSFTPDITKLR